MHTEDKRRAREEGRHIPPSNLQGLAASRLQVPPVVLPAHFIRQHFATPIRQHVARYLADEDPVAASDTTCCWCGGSSTHYPVAAKNALLCGEPAPVDVGGDIDESHREDCGQVQCHQKGGRKARSHSARSPSARSPSAWWEGG